MDRRLWAMVVALATGPAVAQDLSRDAAAAIEVMQGRRSADDLTPAQRELLLLWPARGNVAEHCRTLDDAAQELQNSAESLAKCARQRDFSNECSRELRDTRSAADSYQSEISNAAGSCE